MNVRNLRRWGDQPTPAVGDRRWRRASVVALALVTFAGAAACAVAGVGSGPSTVTMSGPTAAEAATLLPTSTLPMLAVKTRYVTTADITKDAAIPGFAAALVAMGFVRGVQRTFQGPSKHLTLAVSRTLMFSTPSDAAAFVSYVRQHAATYFGIGADISPLTSGGRTGWLYRPPSCACHMANPDVIGLVRTGVAVLSLEINGPDATPELLERLLLEAGPRS